jgi:formate-dependent phosphoribosylglycinamide formyltransferase (GAR transformylase)
LDGTRRLGVVLARGETVEIARAKAEWSANRIITELD